MTTFILILIEAILIAPSLAEETSKDSPPTPPKINLRALDDNDNVTTPDCTTNATDEGDKIYLRNGLINPGYRWKHFSAYLDPNYDDNERQKVNDAMYNIMQVLPCITFGIWNRHSSPSGDYVHIKKRQGCSSYVGRRGGAQLMYLETPGCMSVGLIMHEMLHALGFEHEHNRSDRDDFVNIHWENIKDNQGHNFKKQSSDRVSHYGVPYNIYSIMHYYSHAFSKNNKPTMTDKAEKTFNYGYVLRESDIQKLNKMYKC